MAEVAEGRVALMCEDVNRIRHQLVNQLMKHLLSRSPDGGGGGVAHQKGGGEGAAHLICIFVSSSFWFLIVHICIHRRCSVLRKRIFWEESHVGVEEGGGEGGGHLICILSHSSFDCTFRFAQDVG